MSNRELKVNYQIFVKGDDFADWYYWSSYATLDKAEEDLETFPESTYQLQKVEVATTILKTVAVTWSSSVIEVPDE